MRWTLATGINVSSAAGRFRQIMGGDRALELAQRRRERHALPHHGAKPRQQIVAHRRIVDAEHPALANDRTPGDDQFMDVAHGGAREQEIARIEVGPQPFGIDRVPIEHQDVGRFARRERPPSSLLVIERRPV